MYSLVLINSCTLLSICALGLQSSAVRQRKLKQHSRDRHLNQMTQVMHWFLEMFLETYKLKENQIKCVCIKFSVNSSQYLCKVTFVKWGSLILVEHFSHISWVNCGKEINRQFYCLALRHSCSQKVNRLKGYSLNLIKVTEGESLRCVIDNQLDGVGPVDNRPSTD